MVYNWQRIYAGLLACLMGALVYQHDSRSLSSIPTEVTRQQNRTTALLPGIFIIHDGLDQSQKRSYRNA